MVSLDSLNDKSVDINIKMKKELKYCEVIRNKFENPELNAQSEEGFETG